MVIFYQDFEWRQRKSLVDGLPIPDNCPHCGGSAFLYTENMSWWSSLGFIECKNGKSEDCRFNHYSGANIKEIINLWNNHSNENKNDKIAS